MWRGVYGHLLGVWLHLHSVEARFAMMHGLPTTGNETDEYTRIHENIAMGGFKAFGSTSGMQVYTYDLLKADMWVLSLLYSPSSHTSRIAWHLLAALLSKFLI